MDNKTKILYFVDRLRLGGIQKLIIEWISKFDKNDIHVDFLLLDDGNEYDLENTLRNLGCNIYKLSNMWIKKPTDYIRYSRLLDGFFKEHHDYKVIHFHSTSKNYMVMKYSMKYGIPIRISHSHNIDFQTKNKFKKLVGLVFKKKLIKYSTDYFACSKVAGEWLFGEKIVESDKFLIIHNAIDYKKFEFDKIIRNELRKEFNVTEDTLFFGNVGRFSNQKNHTFLIDIFYEINKINSNTKLILIGTGENEIVIKQKVNKLKLNNVVIFTGTRSDVNKIMQAMDVFLLPSLYEGLPVVGVEAQASGLPVFTSKDVVTKEVKISDNLHFISLKHSAYEWAIQILNSDLQRKNTEIEFRKKHYFVEDIVAELSEFYLQ